MAAACALNAVLVVSALEYRRGRHTEGERQLPRPPSGSGGADGWQLPRSVLSVLATQASMQQDGGGRCSAGPPRCAQPPCGPALLVTGPAYGGIGLLEAALRGHPYLRPPASFSVHRSAQRNRDRGSGASFWAEARGPRHHAWEYTQNMLNGSNRLLGLDWYKGLWARLQDGQVGFDASAAYFTAPGAAADAAALLPDLRVVVVLDDHELRAQSLLQYGPKPLPRRDTATGKEVPPPDKLGEALRLELAEFTECMEARPLRLVADEFAFCASRVPLLMPGGYLAPLAAWASALAAARERSGGGSEPRLLVLFAADVMQNAAAAVAALGALLCLPRSAAPGAPGAPGWRLPGIPREAEPAAAVLRRYHERADRRVAQLLGLSRVPWGQRKEGTGIDAMRSVLGALADALWLPSQPQRDLVAVPADPQPLAAPGRAHCAAAPQMRFLCGGHLRGAMDPQRCRDAHPRAFAPGLVIAGQQKCATTTLGSVLRLHPSIVAPQEKELQYFAAGFGTADSHHLHMYYKGHRADRGGLRWYLGQFEGLWRREEKARKRPVIAFDNSASYLSDGGAAEEVATLFPAAHAIALLRDPVARAYSHWRMWVAQAKVAVGHPPWELLGKFRAAEPSDPFLGALRTEAAEYEVCMRERPYSLYRDAEAYCQGRSLFLMRGAYAPMLRRWSRLGPGRLLVLFTEELERAPLAVLRKVEDFLCIPPLPESAIDRSVLGRRFNVDPYDCARYNRNRTGAAHCSPDHWDKAVHQQKAPMSPAAKQLLSRFYAPWDAQLAAMLGLSGPGALPWRSAGG